MNFETTHTLNDTEMESGLIQIWNMGKLEKIFDASIKPRLALCIAHSYGMIWDMEWCPGGTAWEDMNGFKDIDLEILPRLGLLAIACGDGYIRIHSIPHPETLQHSYKNSLYYNEPVVILNPPGVANSTNYETTICKCLSWIKSNNQHLIAGGFGSGLIAVWDLTTTSTLLIIERNNNQIILRPIQSWIGHSAAVNRIKWINNSSKQFIVSCSFDRSAKLWNLKDLSKILCLYD
jgi:general transcription factor 3C polypeptide 2